MVTGILAAVLFLPLPGRAGELRRVLRPASGPTGAARPAIPSVQPRGARFPCFLDTRGRGYPSGPIRPLSELLSRTGRGPLAVEDGGRSPSGLRPERTAGSAASGIDTLRVAFLRCDFLTDRGGALTTTPDGRFDLRTGTMAKIDPPPHDRRYFAAHAEALRRYYRVQSGGHLEIVPTIFPVEADSAFHLGDTMDYGPWAVQADNVNVASEAERMIKDGLEAARRSGQVDFKSFDAFVMVHAGADFQSDVNGDSPGDIPTFTLEFGDTVVVDGKRIRRVLVLPETTSQDDFVGALNGVLAHEFGHILGLPDLYNVRTGLPAVGYFSLMDSGENIPVVIVDPSDSSQVQVTGAVPASLDPWCRLFLWGGLGGTGFVSYLDSRVWVAGESLDVQLPGVLLNGNLALAEIHDSEYYLLENRAQDLDGNGNVIVREDRATGVILGPEVDTTLVNRRGSLEYDSVLPGGGLLVWQIDDRVISGDLADPLGINTNINRRGIRLIEADGIEDQGRRNFGTPWDPFFAGNNDTFGPYTVPRTTSNDGQFTRITIQTTSPPDTVMHVVVHRPTSLDGWPIRLQPAVNVGQIGLLDVTGDRSPEMLFSVGRDIVAVEGKGGRPYPPPDPEHPGEAVVWARGTGTLNPRLAASAALHLLAGTTAGGELNLWTAAGVRLAPSLQDASTPPAFDGPFVAWGGASGAAHAAFIDGTTSPPAVLAAYDTGPATDGGVADAALGNVLFGSLMGPASTELVWATTSGRIHVASVAGVRFESDRQRRQLAEYGATAAPLGQAPLSIVAGPFAGPDSPADDIGAVDVHGRASMIDARGTLLPGWPVDLPAPMVGAPAVGDVDADGAAELVVADTLGNVSALGRDGSQSLGFPVRLGARPTCGPMLADLDGRPGVEIILMSEDGSLHALGARGREIPGYPIAMGRRAITGPFLADFNHEGRLDIAAGSSNHWLIGVSLAQAVPDSAVAWAGDGDGPERNAVVPPGSIPAGDGGLLASRAGELYCYPNPARGDRMHVRLFLEAGQDARADVFDVRGRSVADHLTPRGAAVAGEADIEWNLAGVAPGVYLLRVEVAGPGAPGVRWRTVAVVR